jgi:PAS domain S-box-containing protein
MGDVVIFDLWTAWDRWLLVRVEEWEYLLLAAYACGTAFLLIRRKRDFLTLRPVGWLSILLLLASSSISSNTLVFSFPSHNLLPPPSLPVAPVMPSLSVVGVLPVLAAAAWLGSGPGMLVGLCNGLFRALASAGSVLDVFPLGLYGYLAGCLLHQNYAGRVPLMVRQPLLASPLAGLLSATLLLRTVIQHVVVSGTAGLDYSYSLISVQLGLTLLESVSAAVLVQGVYLASSDKRPVHVAQRVPPYERSLNRQMLSLFVPVILGFTIAMLCGVTVTTLRLARTRAVVEMAEVAQSGGEVVPYFIQTGQGLLTSFARDGALVDDDRVAVSARLQTHLQTLAFFDQLTVYDSTGRYLAVYPGPPEGDRVPTNEEEILLRRVLQTGAVQISVAHRSGRGNPILSFLHPLENEDDELPLGVLVGRVRLDVNPALQSIVAGLQGTFGRGRGFVVDLDGRVVAHPDSSMLLSEWAVSGAESERGKMAYSGGVAYESRNPLDNTREMVYYAPVSGFPWATVSFLPYQVVLEEATKIGPPLAVVQGLMGVALVAAVILVTHRVTRPMTELAAAAESIAVGDLSKAVSIPGNNEVASLGRSFETMRLRLKGRLDDLSQLLSVSQKVSSTLELAEGVPAILDSILESCAAQVARIVLLSSAGAPRMVMARGQVRDGLAGLDRALAKAVARARRPLVVENLTRARTLTELETLSLPVTSVIALPVAGRGSTVAVIWVGYRDVHHFSEPEIDLLSTLAGQTAVLVENARLYEVADSRGRRLEAVLASTADAVAVTDSEGRVALLNPAAERAFAATHQSACGRYIAESDLAGPLAGILQDGRFVETAQTAELSAVDGRALFASVSTVSSQSGQRLGQVAVMRDVTHFKELEQLKSEFVATVSHDLKSPLTLIRGYAAMLPMAGELTEKQTGYVDRIVRGVHDMSRLIDDLLDLGRIEAGVGLEREPCHLGAIVEEAVEAHRERADEKEIVLRVESAERAPVVEGDATLLCHAVGNLVDNAIKYTPCGGTVAVGLSVSRDQVVIAVSDTGAGIPAEHQGRLFEKFYRVRSDEDAETSGTGLGLAIVKSIVERHDGNVWVESEEGAGSTFHIGLPLDDSGPSSGAGKK